MHADEFVLGIAEEEEEEEEDFRVGGWDCPKWSRCVSPSFDGSAAAAGKEDENECFCCS